MKKKCDGCKALSLYAGSMGECSLGYKINNQTLKPRGERYSKPAEECPKPVSNNALCKIIEGATQ